MQYCQPLHESCEFSEMILTMGSKSFISTAKDSINAEMNIESDYSNSQGMASVVPKY